MPIAHPVFMPEKRKDTTMTDAHIEHDDAEFARDLKQALQDQKAGRNPDKAKATSLLAYWKSKGTIGSLVYPQ